MKDIYVVFKSAKDVIKGDSRDKKHEGSVEVHSWSHTMRQPKSATASSAGGHTAERVEHGEMIFTKDIDAASPKLYLACSAGMVVTDVEVYFYRALGGSNTLEKGQNQTRHQYMKIDLKNVIIASVSPTVDSEGLPQETFSLKYSAVQWTYDELGNDGKPTTNKNIQGAWNLAKNNASYS